MGQLEEEEDPQLLSQELQSLRDIAESAGLGLEEQLESVRTRLSQAEENCPAEEDYEDDKYIEPSDDDQSIDDDALADMFSTLL